MSDSQLRSLLKLLFAQPCATSCPPARLGSLPDPLAAPHTCSHAGCRLSAGDAALHQARGHRRGRCAALGAASAGAHPGPSSGGSVLALESCRMPTDHHTQAHARAPTALALHHVNVSRLLLLQAVVAAQRSSSGSMSQLAGQHTQVRGNSLVHVFCSCSALMLGTLHKHWTAFVGLTALPLLAPSSNQLHAPRAHVPLCAGSGGGVPHAARLHRAIHGIYGFLGRAERQHLAHAARAVAVSA